MVFLEFSLVFRSVNEYTIVVSDVSHLKASGKNEYCLLEH